MKYKLWEYVGKNVELIDIDNERFISRVVHFDVDTVNNSNEYSYFDLSEYEIKSIKEIG